MPVVLILSAFILLPLLSFYQMAEEYLLPYVYALMFLLLFIYYSLRHKILYSLTDVPILLVLLYNQHGIIKYGNMAETVMLVMVYLFGKNAVDTVAKKQIVLWGMIAAGVYQGLIGLLQGIKLLPSHNVYFSMTGSFENPGIWGGFMVVCLTSAIAFMSRKKQVVLSGCVVFLSVGVICSDSRAAWLGLIMGLLYLAYYRWNMSFKNITLSLSVLIPISAMLFLCFYKQDSAHGRLLVWRVCMGIVQDYPWWGSGWGTFAHEYMVHQADFIESHPTSNTMLLSDNCYAFNEFLHILCEQGLFGGLSVLVFLAMLFFAKKMKKENLPFRTGLVTFLTFAFFSYPCSSLLFNMMLAMVCGILSAASPAIHIRSSLGKLATSLACVIVMCPLVDRAIQRHKIENALSSYVSNLDNRSLAPVQKHFSCVGYDLGFMSRYAKILFLTGNYDDAIPAIKQALILYPTSDKYCDLGLAWEALHEYRLAEQAYMSASRLVPHLLRPRYSLFLLYKEHGRKEHALLMARSILAVTPKTESGHGIRIREQARRYLDENHE